MITVIGSLKGGSGKSTTSFNLAVWLLTQDFTTAIFDLDPQQTLADTAECRAEDNLQPVLEVLSPKSRIKDKLIAANEAHVEVLVDIGNSNMSAAKIAYQVADRIVIPVLPSQSDVWSLQRFLRILDLLDTKPNLEILVFVNRGDTHHAVMETRETLAVLKQLPGITVITKLLSQRMGFRRSFSEGMGIFELEPRSKAAAEFLFFARNLYPLRKGRKKVQKKKVNKRTPQKAVVQKSSAAPASKKKVSKKKPLKKA